ncbi:sterol 24-C-methyltransferase erg-4-like isoform X2 [Branchiostoma floridae]|uniref:Sterol 24-C-methyltransferase erg-4-like isoform X2 n=1 Tax=Branchiostoma floridae TaxID=7739 RepID=A0A9J7MQE7_BRAFL|nr:sterol 24-C-methyltransferase erg-4-like isoform X2 [Branchiostoma floridae]
MLSIFQGYSMETTQTQSNGVRDQTERIANIKQRIRYRHTNKIYIDLRQGKIDIADLIQLDQWHYNGTEPIQMAIDKIGIGEGDKVLDVGSGIGGPARFLAHATKCDVTACELLPENHDIGVDLTNRSGMGNNVTHVCGDILTADLGEESFDSIMSIQVFFHVSNKAAVYKRCFDLLKPGGAIYIEDFYRMKDINREEREVLTEFLNSTDDMVTMTENKCLLEDAGFTVVEMKDFSTSYRQYTYNRWADWMNNPDKYVQLYGQDNYNGWLGQASTTKQLCHDFGVMAGGYFVARKA